MVTVARALPARGVRAASRLAAGLGLAAALVAAAAPAPADAASCGPIRNRDGMIVGWVWCPVYSSHLLLPDYLAGSLADQVTQPALDQQVIAR